MGRGTSAVEGEAAELVVDAQQAKNRKTKKTKQQQSQLGKCNGFIQVFGHPHKCEWLCAKHYFQSNVDAK